VPEAKDRKIRGWAGAMVLRGYNMTYLAVILRPKLNKNGLYDWEGQNEKWDVYRTSGMVRMKR
jgi:hypothetical protein